MSVVTHFPIEYNFERSSIKESNKLWGLLFRRNLQRLVRKARNVLRQQEEYRNDLSGWKSRHQKYPVGASRRRKTKKPQINKVFANNKMLLAKTKFIH